MKNAINWKPYLIIGTVISVFCLIFNLKIGLGFLIGSVVFFINLLISEKKFPSFDSKGKTISKALGVMLIEGLITIAMAIGTYMLGGLYSFLAGFAAMIIPNVYFFIVGSKK